MPTLKYGNRGSAVAFVQNLLRRRRYNIPVDGIFGQMTRSAVLDFQRMHSLPLTGNVDPATWDALGVTCLPSQYYPPSAPSFPSTPSTPSIPNYDDLVQTLPSYPLPPSTEPNLDGLNYTWEEIGDFRYILTTNKSRYAQGEDVYITFRKRNISDETIVLRYPSEQLFDFYVSNSSGQELYRFSDNIVDTSLPREVVMAARTGGEPEFCVESGDKQWAVGASAATDALGCQQCHRNQYSTAIFHLLTLSITFLCFCVDSLFL